MKMEWKIYWLKCLIVMIIEGDPGVVTIGDLDSGGLVLESLSEQLTWNNVITCSAVLTLSQVSPVIELLLLMMPLASRMLSLVCCQSIPWSFLLSSSSISMIDFWYPLYVDSSVLETLE